MYPPISLHPHNQRYFLFRGHPTVLLTSGEHYGAVINLDFDFAAYLDVLAASGFNLTRVFSGAYVEGEQFLQWMKDHNTLAPKPQRYLSPWARTQEPGYHNGGCRFDLDCWDETYFQRLAQFMQRASACGIVVEFVFFSAQYNDDNWRHSPLHPNNNVNHLPSTSYEQFTTTYSQSLLDRQSQLVRKVVTELAAFDNLYYEICNEPNSVPGPGGTIDWHNHHIQTILDAEATLPQRHLIATNYDRADLLAQVHPAVTVHNVHYAYGDRWIGALALTEQASHLHGILGFDETSDVDFGSTIAQVRSDAWQFLLSGGAVYDHLSWTYTPTDARGTSAVGQLTRQHLKVVKDFVASLPLVRMKPLHAAVRQLARETYAYVLAEPGNVYAMYLKSKDGVRQLMLEMDLPQGCYQVQWIDPLSGAVIASRQCTSVGRWTQLDLPLFVCDIAAHLQRV